MPIPDPEQTVSLLGWWIWISSTSVPKSCHLSYLY